MNNDINSVSRRDFLKKTGITGGALVIASNVTNIAPVWAMGTSTQNQHGLNLFVSIHADGTINVVCHRSEMGQGIRTGIPQIVADELCANWDDIHVVQGLADERYGSQNTDGSRSIRHFYTTMRQMGATARTMLESAAAEFWKVPLSDVYAQDSYVINKSSGKKVKFGYLAELAASQKIPAVDSLTFKSKKDFKFIGKPVTSVDLPKVTTGTTEFGQDVKVEGMLYASISRAPVLGSTVKSADLEGAKKVSGVVDVFQMPQQPKAVGFTPCNGIAILATNTWAANQGRNALNIQWELSEHQSHDSDTFMQKLVERVEGGKGKVIRTNGDAYAALSSANKKIGVTYTVPYLVHAPMEPPAATAVIKDGMCEVWACTQTPQSTQGNVAQALGIEPSNVKVNVTLLGGGFGRKSKPDFSVEAALLARHTGKPVKVIWTREDDIQNGYYHAISAQRFEAGINENGKVDGWVQRTAFPSIGWTFSGAADEAQDFETSLGFGDVPFELNNLSCETHKAEGHTRIGWVRSVSNIHHAFAVGSFVDELASELKMPTHKMWHELLGKDRFVDPKTQGFNFSNYGDPLDTFPVDVKRIKHVLDLVVKNSSADKAVNEGEGWGISVHRSFVSYVAVATKVKVTNGKVEVLEIHSAIDAGTVVNPDRVRSQQEGSMIFGLSIALMGEISFKGGSVQQSNYHDYPVLRMAQCPKIETYIVPSDAPPGGVGEPGTPPVAASLANAIYHASGIRIRNLPINKQLKV